MQNYIFENFEKDSWGNFTNQLERSQYRTVQSYKNHANIKWVQIAEVFCNDLENNYRLCDSEKSVILSILTTAIDKPDVAITPYRYQTKEEFKDFLRLVDLLEKAKLVRRLSQHKAKNGSKKPFALYPTICPQRLLGILDTQELQILKLKHEVRERVII